MRVEASAMSDVLLDPPRVTEALRRIASEIASRAAGEAVVLVAIRRGGEPFARRIAALLDEHGAPRPELGAVDITLYRDDAATALPNPRIGPSTMPRSIDRRVVVLVDDVLHTGRTIRAAVDAVLDFGRPRRIELAVLVDRGGRELPIQADYCGLRVEVSTDARVEVIAKRSGPGPDDEEPWALTVPASPRARATEVIP
jgi:pyrimidine operon attenuation protein/uracil phosphoribosyltransferase